MHRAVIVKGRVTDERHIELDESIGALTGPVEVTVRPVPAEVEEADDILDFLAALPPGTRGKKDIDRQLCDERHSWERTWDRKS